MSSSEFDLLEDIEPNTLSFASTNDFYSTRLKHELSSCLKYLIKILSPNDLALVSQNLSSTVPLVLLQNCFNLSENIKKLIKQGPTSNHFSLSTTHLSLSQELDVSVTSRCSGKDVLGLLIKCDKSGVYLSSKESKSIFALLIGSLRDSALTSIHLACRDLREKTCKKRKKFIKVGKEIENFKFQLEEVRKSNEEKFNQVLDLEKGVKNFEVQVERVKTEYFRKIEENKKIQERLMKVREAIRMSLARENCLVNLQLMPSILPEDRVIL